MLLDREMSSASCSSVRGTRAEAPGCGRLAIGQRIKSIVGLDCGRHMEIKKSWVVEDTEGRAFFGSEGNNTMQYLGACTVTECNGETGSCVSHSACKQKSSRSDV